MPLWGQGHIGRGCDGVSLCVTIVRSQLGEGPVELWQEQHSHPRDLVPGQGVHSLLVGMLRQQENRKF